MPAEELLFEPTPAFGKYKTFLEHAVAHPAKMNTNLLKFLILNFTKEGEVILDPMAGSGSTAVVAALHGRNAVCVELEKRFYEWMEKARLNVEKHPTLTPKGRIVNICGDARRLSELLSRADVAITSPPYAETYMGGGDPEKRKERLVKAGRNPKDFLGGKARNAVLKHYGEVDVCLTSGVRKVGVSTITAREYSQNPANIGNLPLGEVSTIITSPPYHNVDNVKPKSEEFWRKAHEGGKRWGSKSPSGTEGKQITAEGNISNFPLGNIDAVITSPPYEMQHQGGPDPNPVGTCIKERYPSESNIGNLPLGSIDCCITSPPYSEALSEKAGGGSKKNVLGVGITSDGEKQAQGAPTPYSTSEENIGNLKHGEIDVVLTSPPYEASVSDDKESPLAGGDEKKYGRWRKGTARKHSYTQHGEPCKVDTVITSPPYEGSLEGTTRHTRGGIASRDPALAQTGSYATLMSFGVPVGYSPNKDNIGNLKSSHEEYEALTTTPRGPLAKGLMKNGKPTYLSEMLKVYAEMFKVLKPAGLAIVVVKSLIRNKRVIDLPWHSWLMLERVGFKLVKLYKLRLKNSSFWRILYTKKFPDVPLIAHEYVLVCGKSPVPVEPAVDAETFRIEALVEDIRLRRVKQLAKQIKLS